MAYPSPVRSRRVTAAVVLALTLPAAVHAQTAATTGTSSALVVSTGDASSGGKTSTATPSPFTGSVTYPMPIEVPRGRGDMKPDLFLTYSNTAGNSWTGVGFTLELGAVERSTKNGIDYGADRYVMKDGSGTCDLVTVGTDAYRSEIEGAFTRVQKVAASDGRPAFVATDRSGMRYYYGTSDASRTRDPANPTRVYRWHLDRVVDTNGNALTVAYTAITPAELYPRQIDYTFEWNAAGHPPAYQRTNRVRFHLEGRPDHSTTALAGFAAPAAMTRRLKTIEIQADGVVQRAYKLVYDTGSDVYGTQSSGTTERSLLTAVRQFGRDALIDSSGTVTSGSVLSTTTIAWSSTAVPAAAFTGGNTYGTSGSEWDSDAQNTNWFSNDLSVNFDEDNWPTVRYADVDGDGLADACGRHDAGIQCVLARAGKGFDYAAGYDPTAPGSVRIAQNGADQRQKGSFNDNNWKTIQFADVTGDGRADACIRMDYGFQCWVSTGAGWSYSAGFDSGASGQGIFANKVIYGSLEMLPIGWDGIQRCRTQTAMVAPTSVCGARAASSAGFRRGPAGVWTLSSTRTFSRTAGTSAAKATSTTTTSRRSRTPTSPATACPTSASGTTTACTATSRPVRTSRRARIGATTRATTRRSSTTAGTRKATVALTTTTGRRSVTRT
jgi:hypothetical protein